MNSVALRLYLVVALVAGAYGVSRWLQITTAPPEVEMPNWSLKELPYQLGKWQGTDAHMDPKIAAATGATVIVDRDYRNALGQVVSLHTAMFEDAAVGVYHSPMNCYPANGWQKRDETRHSVQISETLTLEVRLVTWEKEGEKVLLGYWYQLGNHVLYDRFDLGSKVRWEMRDQSKWPVLLKVMIVMPRVPQVDSEEARTILAGFAEEVARWLNQPDHQKYLGQWNSL